jgi:hypothetical protein
MAKKARAPIHTEYEWDSFFGTNNVPKGILLAPKKQGPRFIRSMNETAFLVPTTGQQAYCCEPCRARPVKSGKQSLPDHGALPRKWGGPVICHRQILREPRGNPKDCFTGLTWSVWAFPKGQKDGFRTEFGGNIMEKKTYPYRMQGSLITLLAVGSLALAAGGIYSLFKALANPPSIILIGLAVLLLLISAGIAVIVVLRLTLARNQNIWISSSEIGIPKSLLDSTHVILPFESLKVIEIGGTPGQKMLNLLDNNKRKTIAEKMLPANAFPDLISVLFDNLPSQFEDSKKSIEKYSAGIYGATEEWVRIEADK